MSGVEKSVATIAILLAAAVIWQSTRMNYYTDIGPGPGFFPLWLGLILLVLSSIWFVSLFTKRTKGAAEGVDGPSIFIDRASLSRVLVVAGAIVAVASVMEFIGFRLAMFCFVAFVLTVLGRRDWLRVAVIAFCLSFGTQFVFVRWLDVTLPSASISFLKDLDL